MRRIGSHIRHPALTLISILTLLSAVAGAGATDAPAATPEKQVSSDAPATHCIRLYAIRSSKVIDGQTILFELSGNKTLVNRLPRKCPGLGVEKRFLYKTSLNQLCSQDLITVLTSFGRGATCGLGKFEEYVPPETLEAAPDRGAFVPEP